jgi:hypothetical protein
MLSAVTRLEPFAPAESDAECEDENPPPAEQPTRSQPAPPLGADRARRALTVTNTSASKMRAGECLRDSPVPHVA